MKKLLFMALFVLSFMAHAETVSGNLFIGTLGWNGLPNQAVDKWEASCPIGYPSIYLMVSDNAPMKTPLVYGFIVQGARTSANVPDTLDGDNQASNITRFDVNSTKFVVNIVKTTALGTNPTLDLGYEIYNVIVSCWGYQGPVAVFANPINVKLIQNQ